MQRRGRRGGASISMLARSCVKPRSWMPCFTTEWIVGDSEIDQLEFRALRVRFKPTSPKRATRGRA